MAGRRTVIPPSDRGASVYRGRLAEALACVVGADTEERKCQSV